MRKIGFLLQSVLFLFSIGICEEKVIMKDGGEFSSGSVNIVKDEKRFAGGAKLYGGFNGGYAIYEFQVDTNILIEKMRIEVDFLNPRRKSMGIFLEKSKPETQSLKIKGIGEKWTLFERTGKEDNWTSSVFQNEFKSEDGIIRILLYADGGFPLISDALFYISRVSLFFETSESPQITLVGFKPSEFAYIEESVVVARGVGIPPKNVSPSRARILAERAARVVAYRNLLIALGNGVYEDGVLRVKGIIQFVRTREVKVLDDGSVEMIVEMPIDVLQEKETY